MAKTIYGKINRFIQRGNFNRGQLMLVQNFLNSEKGSVQRESARKQILIFMMERNRKANQINNFSFGQRKAIEEYLNNEITSKEMAGI